MMKKFFAFALFFVAFAPCVQAELISNKQLSERRKAQAAAEVKRKEDQLQAQQDSVAQQKKNNKLMKKLLKQNEGLDSKFDELIDSNNQQNDLILELLRRTE